MASYSHLRMWKGSTDRCRTSGTNSVSNFLLHLTRHTFVLCRDFFKQYYLSKKYFCQQKKLLLKAAGDRKKRRSLNIEVAQRQKMSLSCLVPSERWGLRHLEVKRSIVLTVEGYLRRRLLPILLLLSLFMQHLGLLRNCHRCFFWYFHRPSNYLIKRKGYSKFTW